MLLLVILVGESEKRLLSFAGIAAEREHRETGTGNRGDGTLGLYKAKGGETPCFVYRTKSHKLQITCTSIFILFLFKRK